MFESRHPYGPRDRSLRAADSDRDAVAEVLREQHSLGRIDTEEFQERIDRCYAAKTYAQLDDLVADFPGQEQPAPAGPAYRRRSRAVPILLVVLALIVLSHGFLLFLAIPLFFFVFRPMMRGRGGFGCGFCGSGRRSQGASGTYL